MTGRALRLSLGGGLALAGLAAVAGVVAWPEMVASGYFLSQGWRLYEDVIQQYTPILMYVVAAFGAVLGFDPQTFRFVVSLSLFAQGLLLGLAILRRRAPLSRVATYVAALAAVAFWTAYLDAFALWPDSFLAPFALGAVLLLEEFDRNGRTRPLALAGLVLGSGVLVKQTFAWAAIGAGLWLLLQSRRRSPRRVAVFAGTVAAPYLAFCALWAAFFGTWAHVRWTLVLPLTRHAADMGGGPDRADLLESIAPFLVFAALGLLGPPRAFRSAPSPLVWVALATTGMAWPRWGLLHLSATTALLGLAMARALRAGAVSSRRLGRSRSRSFRIPVYATGAGLLLTHVAIAAAGGGAELASQFGSGVRFWDEPPFALLSEEASRRIAPGQELFVYHATHDNLYVRSRTFTPGRLYVNPGFWFFLEEDGLDGRLVDILDNRPGLPVLYRTPADPDFVHARKTKLWHFLDRNTQPVPPGPGGVEWRRISPPSLSGAPAPGPADGFR